MTIDSINRRTHKRFATNGDEIAVCSETYGQVMNISEGGMMIKLIDVKSPVLDSWTTNFFCSATDTIIRKLPVRLVRKEKPELPRFGGFTTQTVGVKFDNPKENQQKQIRGHISRLPVFNLPSEGIS